MSVSNSHEPQPPQGTEPPLPSDRSTGLVLAVALAVPAWFLRNSAAGLLSAIGSIGLALTSLIAPAQLRSVNVVWMRLAALIHKLVSPVVLLIIFALLIVPFGLAMQRLRDPLRRRRDMVGTTYWRRRDTGAGSAGDMRRQF
jgi:hypothetical protein